MSDKPRIRILGLGSAVPDKIVTNDELSQTIDTNDAWIRERTGIHERRIAGANTPISDYAFKAGQRALENAGIKADQLGMIIVATATPDNLSPSISCVVQHKLGAPHNAFAFDMNAACSGFLYALSLADKYIRSGAIDYALIIGAEVFSRVLDWTDRQTCILFGDAAGAAVVGKSQTDSNILGLQLYADGAGAVHLGIRGKGDRPEGATGDIYMNGREVFKSAIKCCTKAIKNILDEHSYKVDDVDVYVSHQANIRIIHGIADAVGIPKDKAFTNLERYGNTSAASIPLALDEAVQKGEIKSGQLVLLSAIGAGYTWGAGLIRW